MSVSKKFGRGEYDHLMAWLKGRMPDEMHAAMPSWDAVKDWPGRIVGTIDYWVKQPAECTQEDLAERQLWNEGYGCWWTLANPRAFAEPIPCRGNVGFWKLPEDVQAKVNAIDISLGTRR